jgi:hypothetical protein
MSFIIVHANNGYCGQDPIVLNIHHIVSVTPLRGDKKWSLESSSAHIGLMNGVHIHTTEHFDVVTGMLREASGGGRIPGTGPHLQTMAQQQR